MNEDEIEMKDIEELNIPEFLKHSRNTIYMAGSYAEGYSTKTSDLDIYEIYQGKQPETNRIWDYRKIRDIKENDTKFEIELISKDSILILSDKIDKSIDFGEDSFIISFQEYQLIWDILIGISICNPEALQGYKSIFESKKESIADLLVRQIGLFIMNAYEDILGLLAAGELESAYFRSLDLLNRTADSLIADKKIFNTKTKWRYKKLEQAGLYEFRDMYHSFFTRPVTNKLQFIEEIVVYCSMALRQLTRQGNRQWIDISRFKP